MKTKLILSDANLKMGIRIRKQDGLGKLAVVKWVYDNSDKGLKDSKEFVDNT